MIFPPKKILLPKGERVVLRSPEPEDADALIRYMKKTTTETPFLLRNPEEIHMTLEEERAFLLHRKESERELMLLAEIHGVHAGSASLSSVSSLQRLRHRCSLAIALYKEYWGLGLGRAMLNTLLEQAVQLGYEQAELQVVTGNERAIALYQSLGFTICGTQPHSMKYPDGSYADEYTMIKPLG